MYLLSTTRDRFCLLGSDALQRRQRRRRRHGDDVADDLRHRRILLLDGKLQVAEFDDVRRDDEDAVRVDVAVDDVLLV